MRLSIFSGLALAVCTLLGGCAGVVINAATDAATGTNADKLASATAVVYRENLDLRGRLSVRYQLNGKEEGLHGHFEWQQRGQEIDITLRSPLGQTMAQIAVRDGSAQMVQAGQATKTARDVDALVAETLGWPLPIAGLRRWLQGQGQRNDGSHFIASKALDSVSTQDGWRLRYVSWHDGGTPRRIDLERNTVEAGDVGLKLILDAP